MGVLDTVNDAVTDVSNFAVDPFGLTSGTAHKVADVAKADQRVKVSQLLAEGGFTGADLTTARQVTVAESGGRADAVNKNTDGTQDTGLMQINDVHCPPGTPIETFRQDMKDPRKNVKKGYEVYREAGNRFTPWVTFKTGAYKLSGSRDPVVTIKESASASDIPVVGTVVDGANAVGDLIGAILDKNTWLRLGKGFVGVELITIGFVGLVVIALKDPIKQAAKGTAKVYTKGGRSLAGAAIKATS